MGTIIFTIHPHAKGTFFRAAPVACRPQVSRSGKTAVRRSPSARTGTAATS